MHLSYTTVFGDPTHSEGLLADPCFAAKSSREHRKIRWDHKTQSFLPMSASSFSADPSYGIPGLSAISLLIWSSYQQTESLGGVSNRTIDQFARSLTGSQTSACDSPSLRDQQTYNSTKFQPNLTSSTKASPLVWRVLIVQWGGNTGGKKHY